MGKLVNNLVLDAALDYIKQNGTQISVCIDTPTTYSHATTTDNKVLAIKSDLTNASYEAIGDGASGRMLTVKAAPTLAVVGAGTQNATHICICAAATNLLYVTTCVSQALVNGNTVTIPVWTIQISDPSA
jgi:hypothetical protein